MLSSLFGKKTKEMVKPEDALPGRHTYAFEVPATHEVLGNSIHPPFPANLEVAYFALGCFWGAERLFWEEPGVWTTAVGYQGGYTPYPTYPETCTGQTGHAETVLVAFDPAEVTYEQLLQLFFEAHDPTQGMRQGGDVGSQYRSAIYTTSDEQAETAKRVAASYNAKLQAKGFGPITTEIAPAGPFYYAEDYHQQYLHKVPDGYCGLAGTGVSCPIRFKVDEVEGDPMLKPLPSDDAEWKSMLSPEEYKVLREAGTERPFTGEYTDTETPGEYRCRGCGNLLFDADTKFHSGCGWPSFTEALPGATEYIEDNSHGMHRTEVRCARCHSHLGHVFNDGPRDRGGMRYCMNSIALDLVPEE